MAGPVIARHPARRGSAGLAGAALWLACAQALALGPLAPFTPPPALAASAAQGSLVAQPADATGLSGAHITKGRSQALIDGRWWPVGSSPRGARLISVQRHEARLRHSDGRIETLTLHPATNAVTAQPPATATPANGGTPR